MNYVLTSCTHTTVPQKISLHGLMKDNQGYLLQVYKLSLKAHSYSNKSQESSGNSSLIKTLENQQISDPVNFGHAAIAIKLLAQTQAFTQRQVVMKWFFKEMGKRRIAFNFFSKYNLYNFLNTEEFIYRFYIALCKLL